MKFWIELNKEGNVIAVGGNATPKEIKEKGLFPKRSLW